MLRSARRASPWDGDEVLREELFSVERLEQHAASLALAQQVTPQPRRRPPLRVRLRDNETVLLDAYRALAKAVGEGRDVTPAAEWLLDNYHLVEAQIREIREDLPPGFYRLLPKLASGPFEGYPRVFGIAWAYVAHTDSHFEPESLRRFVTAYQAVQPLTIGELWAVAITLRIVLVENLRRAAHRIVRRSTARQDADEIADRILGLNGHVTEPDALIARHLDGHALPPSFAVQLVQRLRDQDPRVTPSLAWLEEQLAATGTTAEAVVREEHQRQGSSSVTVRNIITSMRLISELDWSELVEGISLVDAELRAGSDFAQMDFATRNLYRTGVEDLSRGSGRDEINVARAAMAAARKASDPHGHATDPGFHLIGSGRRAFEDELGYRAPLRRLAGRWIMRHGAGQYVGAIVVVALAVLVLAVTMLPGDGMTRSSIVLLALLGFLPALDIAVAFVNRAVTAGFDPSILPGLALREGVPPELRTVVAVPTLLASTATIEAEIERLEIHFLASPEGELHFALLSDWADSATEHSPEDDALFAAASSGIARLNRLYGPAPAGDRFLHLHRRRLWSETQRCWMGWERKRGKIHELNRLLRGATDTSFLADPAQPHRVPADVRYVITLDADTRLPRGAARRLIGKLSHPLNRPRFDAATGRVAEGYAVLQPRITPSLPTGHEGSLFQRIVSTKPGLDPYAAAVSDVYQDLFGEGSYAGKGIYDIDAFEAAHAGRSADGTLLSHDLFEGIFARAGLASDVEVVEEFPERYDIAAARQHRWARGDWQLLPWLFGRRHATRSDPLHSALPLIGFWKILDNLRRTLTAPSSVAALVAGWTLSPRAAVIWTTFVVATMVLPTLPPVIAALLPRRSGITASSHLRSLGTELLLAVRQAGFQIVFLPYQAWLMADAIGRTLFRLFVSHRNLLEWVTAAQSSQRERPGPAESYRGMAGGVAVTLAAALIVGVAGSAAWPLAVPFVLVWLTSPAIAFWISRAPPQTPRLRVSDADARALRIVARRTWRYFETFVTANDHMLPPDNFQEDPSPVLARRTSPTNMGLYLLSVVSARDFGWINTTAAVERLEATLATMNGLARFRGHFYNWYDTADLRPLEPRYVSSVDSGNLAAHLMTVASAAKEWADTPPAAAICAGGARDALSLAREALRALPPHLPTQAFRLPQLDEQLDAIEVALTAAESCTDELGPRLQSLTNDAATLVDIARTLVNEGGADEYGDLLFWSDAVHRSLDCWRRAATQTGAAAGALRERLLRLGVAASLMAEAMDFGFLLDPQRKLLSIGYRADDGALDPSCYDLLASEARLASFFGIAKGDIGPRHWFRLGRPVTAIGHGAALISWSGSMFEYLMPSLVMQTPTGSLIEQTNRLVVRRQMAYGTGLGLPWGISESAYNARDLELTYQYSNFGVPGLGLKRGLSENAVVAPYATALAAMVEPEAAARNFEALASLGAIGRHGMYEALDYTRSRLPANARYAIVRAYMAHHQGMTIAAIGNVLLDGILRRRFHANANVQATELLLQERTPRDVSVDHPRAEEVQAAARIDFTPLPDVRRLHTANDSTPQTHLLSNGRYSVMVTAAGSGYSRWRDLAITRWREDVTRDDAGSYIFLRDVESGRVWSAGHQPCCGASDGYDVTFTEDRAEIARTERGMTTRLKVIVSPEDDAEVRHLSISNTSNRARIIEVTSYAELVLAPNAADLAHPAFSKLFVQTEFVARYGALLATRRKRSPEEPDVWAAHHVVVEGDMAGPLEFETDRARFLGRGREIGAPIALADGRRLSNTVGTVLDAVFSLRCRVRVPAGATVRVAYWTAVASSRQAVLDLLDKHRDQNAFVRASTLAWTQAQVQLRHLGIAAADAGLFQRLAGHVLFADGSLRPSSGNLRRDSGAPSALWSQGISGDLPIVLLKIDDVEDLAIARQLLQAHEYWRLKQLAVDLVILNERSASYLQDLQNSLEALHRTSQSRGPVAAGATRGSVFILRTDLIAPETRAVLSFAARVTLASRNGSLVDQLDRPLKPWAGPDAWRSGHRTSPNHVATGPPPSDLEFFNGLGGFAADGREYVTQLGPGQSTPAPWINVIANPAFGFQVAAEGSGYTWSENSRENQLTPWSNDPVSDRTGEALYLRDDETGELWGPTAAPVHDPDAFHCARHGQGYSRFTHESRGIALDLLVYVPLEDPIKILRLSIRNLSGQTRRLSVTAYAEWVLGQSRTASAPFVVTEVDPTTGAIFAQNRWNAAFGSRVAFADLGGAQMSWTADRREFVGRHGNLAEPAALLSLHPLSGRVGAGFDPCAALQASLVLEAGATTEVRFFLGEAADATAAQALLQKFRSADLDAVYHSVVEHWDALLGKVQVRTPDRAMDILLNRWMLYQTVACRLWARSAFYQASGAYGYRDQLQDGMALAVASPQLTREHLLRAAGRQFPEGDVQHWWLPATGAGVRTRISDDRVWLAYATAHYVSTTADAAVLDAAIPWIEGPALRAGEQDAFGQPAVSDAAPTLFEHCAWALDQSLSVGSHGLPLIGAGDWNDGMNRVGELGRGESVWLGWFLYATLREFAPWARARGEDVRAARWLAHAAGLQAALDRDGWDGDWYRRGFFDDGTALGSAANEECRIDSIAQSWSVISGATAAARAAKAMAALDGHLIDRDNGLALLFAPPFNRTAADPGYVKGYPPGIRENGGQYTHAATWSVMAFAALGQGARANELYALLNPINRTTTRMAVHRYKVEPYVVAADIYSVTPHAGRGGWTWYTGSAGWMYRAGLESILGLCQQGTHLRISPCIPAHWPGFEVVFLHRSTRYEIVIENPQGAERGVATADLDGQPLAPGPLDIALDDDGVTHRLRVTLGSTQP